MPYGLHMAVEARHAERAWYDVALSAHPAEKIARALQPLLYGLGIGEAGPGRRRDPRPDKALKLPVNVARQFLRRVSLDRVVYCDFLP